MNEPKTALRTSKLQWIRNELDALATRSPNRVELERRRLIAHVINQETQRFSENRSKKSLIYAIVSTIIVFVAALGFYLFGWEALVSNPVSIKGAWTMRPGDPLTNGKEIAVPTDSSAKIILENGSVLWLDSDSTLRFRDTGITTIEFQKGHLLADVIRSETSNGLRVETKESNLIAHRSIFSLTKDKPGLKIRLYAGSMMVEAGEDFLVLSPGQQLRVADKRVLSLTRLDQKAIDEDLKIAEKTSAFKGPPFPELGKIDP